MYLPFNRSVYGVNNSCKSSVLLRLDDVFAFDHIALNRNVDINQLGQGVN